MGLIALAFASCNQSDILNQNEALEKSATVAINEIQMESTLEEGLYEAGFYSETEKLLRQMTKIQGRHNKLVHGNKGMRYADGTYPDVSLDSTSSVTYPVTITLDYGEGTELKNGKVFAGKIEIVLTAPKGTDGATKTISYLNFSVDSVSVNGTITETWSVTESVSKSSSFSGTLDFVLADGSTIKRTEVNTRKWISGLDTPLDHTDDTIEVTGKAEATSSNSESYTKEITTPLVKTGECRNYVQGVVSVIQNGVQLFTLDYGNGECDNLAEMTVNGETTTIELKDKLPKVKGKKGKRTGK
jgi:hypothetical protein